MRLSFNVKYLLPAAFLFALEICIALFVTDSIVRPFVGDALVVILIYCFLRIFFSAASYWKTASGVLAFACAIEILQYFDYVARLGLENNRVLSVALGRTFEWLDFAAYLAGFLFIILIENFYRRKTKNDL
ncbi:MAG TPA: DUF2809 domain-containing protein [Pyrinomonadaceae bacterium]|nr:DUF2809 domain-containing protein [Pyrinomonadaceae bacterium]